DLASIYGVPFARDDVGAIATLLAMGAGIELLPEPTRHDKPAQPGATKPWRVVRQMQRADFAGEIGKRLVEQSVLRNVVPVAGVLVSAAWDQVVLRRFAREAHVAVRARRALVRACRGVQLGAPAVARPILDGAWLVATADGDLDHSEALALSTLLDTLPLPERIAVDQASFCDDEERWFAQLPALDEQARDRVLEVLVLVAVADGRLCTPERRFLRRAGSAIGREVDLARVDRLCARLRAGEQPVLETSAYAKPCPA
ncbi:MAG TPA: TerB family tellurite resistance protein, partial [Polyangiaceae bacterium]|nr:TerB family tellurite resistance protein [Polyangiaceae bacterium]